MSEERLQGWRREHWAVGYEEAEHHVLVLPAAVKQLPRDMESYALASYPMDSNMQLSSRQYMRERRAVWVGDTCLGGEGQQTCVVAGPCSVESQQQIEDTAAFMKEMGVKVLRAGCYKPRTSPYAFQGLGKKGLELLASAGKKYGLAVITEVRDATHFDDVEAFSDIIQVGAKAMYDHGILRACGRSKKPVLLKRGFGTTLQEFVQASEFVLSGGNAQVMLCERGIRTFETKTRFTLDLCGVAYLKEHTNLPLFVDPSHAMGFAYGVPDLALASMAMGVEGLLVEVHPTPEKALSDASQQLSFEAFRVLYQRLKPVAQAIGRTLS